MVDFSTPLIEGIQPNAQLLYRSPSRRRLAPGGRINGLLTLICRCSDLYVTSNNTFTQYAYPSMKVVSSYSATGKFNNFFGGAVTPATTYF